MNLEESKDINDEDLDYVRGMRKKILDSQFEKGVPADNETLSVAAKILADMSKDALGKKRLKQEEKVNGAANAAVELFSAMFKDRDIRSTVPVSTVERTEPPKLPDNVVIEFDPEEMSPIGKQLDYDSFLSQTNK